MNKVKGLVKGFLRCVNGLSWRGSAPSDKELFIRKYPTFSYGKATYGIPKIKRWDKHSQLSIGSYCSISRNVQIFLGGNHRTDWITTFPFPHYYANQKNIANYEISKGNVTIGHDVWLGDGCTILSGVTIGHGAVIGCNAVVTKDVPAYAIVVGNPGKVTRYRFDDDIINALLKAAWWDWPEEELVENMEKLCSDDIGQFISYAESRNPA